MFNRLVKRMPLGLLCHVFLMILILQLGASAQAQPKVLPAPAPKRVLLLYTYGDGLPAYEKATPAFISVMTAGGINVNDLFFEYLDLQRNDDAEYRQRFADLLRYKYAKHQVGLIVTVHTAALDFLLNEGKGIFPDAPVFSYLIVRPDLIEAKSTERRILQRPQNLDMGGTLEIALKMFPQARKVVFVTGTADGDRRFENEAKRLFEPWRDKLEFQYTSDLSVEEIVTLVSSLPPQSIVIYSNVFSDKTGRTFTPREVGKMVAKAANAPVFCLWDTLIGGGAIGGSLLSFEAEGAYAANMVLDILNGKIVLTKPVTTLTTSKTFMFDWQQLKRWGVNESILPKESVLVNRVPTLWEQYKGFIIGGIAVFLAQTLLVIGLLVQRRRKEVVEASLRQKTEELDQFFNVNLDLLCIANTDGNFQRLNPAAERILGYTRQELMATPFLDFVHPDDLDKTRKAVSTLASQQKVFSFENRYRCKDGTYRWLQWNSTPAGKLIYAAARDITERKLAEQELRKSEERFRMLIETMNEGLGARNENGVWTYVNDQLCWMLGLLPGDITGHPVKEFLDEVNQKVFAEEIQKQRERNYSPYEITWTRTDGRKVTTIVSPKPIFDPEGQLKEVFSVFTDITDRKRMEEILREKEEEAREAAREMSVLAEIGRIVSSTLHIDQIYEAFAAEAKKIIPFDRIVINLIDSEKGTAKNVYIAGEEVQDRVVENIYPVEGSGNAEMLRTKSTFLLQTDDFREYKDRFPMLLSTFEAGFRSIMNVPLFSKGEVTGGLLLRSRKRNAYTDKEVKMAESIGNEIAGAIAIAQSFQEQKQMENRLRESEERFRQVAETVGDFIWEIDANGLYRYTSPSVEKILGYTPGELIGKMHFYDLFVPEVREELKTAAFEVFAAKEAFRAFPNPNRRKDGKVVHLETSGVPVLDETGNLVGYRGADTDVTDRKRAEKETLDARRELLRMDRLSRMGELSASLSHELNQPLTAILSNARAALRFLQANKLDPGELEEILQDIVKDDKRAGDIIRSLRTLLMKDTGERETISINDVLHETVSLFQSEAVIRNIRIEMDLADSLPLLDVNKVQIQQVLINLMMNAAESMARDDPANKAIVLQTLVSRDGMVQVAVRDFGSGIEEPDLQRIFEAFFTTKRSGLGMGLSLSRSIIESHGGHIWAENNLDKGITFYFDLPGTKNEGKVSSVEGV
jgi:PAS domain S-box-containing protein